MRLNRKKTAHIIAVEFHRNGSGASRGFYAVRFHSHRVFTEGGELAELVAVILVDDDETPSECFVIGEPGKRFRGDVLLGDLVENGLLDAMAAYWSDRTPTIAAV